MRFPVPTEVLRSAREASGIKQSVLAGKLETNNTFVSRLEKTQQVDAAFAEKYLRALETELADQILAYYDRPWQQMSPPSFLHMDRENLWRIDSALTQISTFEQSPENGPILRIPIASLREDLTNIQRYIERQDHTIAWVGDISVGKTTALAYATNLLVADTKGALKSVFPVGSGRVTVCETVIKGASAYGVAVEPVDEREINTLAQELVAHVSGAPVSVPAETARVLRNMSGFKTNRIPKGRDDYENVDPLEEALKAGEKQEILADRMIAAMNLPGRRETSLTLSEEVEDGMVWLARTIAKINSGLDDRFSFPRRITVFVPSPQLRQAGDLSIVDTKGVEAITQRPDIRSYLDDHRTLVVLCNRFGDAPNAMTQRILAENAEAGSDAADRQRLAILVLPRGDEPLQVLDQGEPPSNRKEGYAIRRDEVKRSLSGAGFPAIPQIFYDAHTDRPDVVWDALRERVTEMRNFYVERLDRSLNAVFELVNNVDVVKTRGARIALQQKVERLVERLPLPGVRRAAHQNLMDQFDVGHQSSIAASIVRRGEWEKFSILHILGVGVRQDANLRCAELMIKIDDVLEDAELEYHDLPDIVSGLKSLKDRVAEWRQEFLGHAFSIGRDAFKVPLSNETELWAKSQARYGTYVPGYKKDVASFWREFFESSAPDGARAAVELRLADAWLNTVINPLMASTRAED